MHTCVACETKAGRDPLEGHNIFCFYVMRQMGSAFTVRAVASEAGAEPRKPGSDRVMLHIQPMRKRQDEPE